VKFWSPTVFSLLVSLCLSFPLIAREWTDALGTHKFEGDLFAATDDTVVLRRKKGELEAYQTDQLSEADREFLNQHLEREEERRSAGRDADVDRA